MADLTGQLFGNYRLVQLLGQGGFADVYLAEHIHLDSRAAVKILQARLVGNALEQFRNEGRSIASLVHPNIVRVFDFGIESGIPFLVMDYAPNGTLRQRYPKGTALSPLNVLPHVKQVAQALHYAHGRKLIHRDIKPENMLLGANNEVLLSDFGLVLPAQSTGSQTTKEMAGTLPYMAPEQINGKPRPASDQYALGIVLYEWLSGKRPFDGTFVEIATQHMMTPPPPLYGRAAGVSQAVQEVLFTALAKDPARRFASIQAFATAFESVCQPGEVSSRSTVIGPSPQDPIQMGLGDSSSAPTYVKSPAPTYPQPSPALNASDMPGDWSQVPTENALSDSSGPTYIKTPPSTGPQQSSPMHTPVPAVNDAWSQVPTENALSDPSVPTYIKTPPSNYPQQPFVLRTPSSPQQPAVVAAPTNYPQQPKTPVVSAGGIYPAWPEMTPVPTGSGGYSPTPRRKKGRAVLVVFLCLLVAALVGSGFAYAIIKGIFNMPGTTVTTVTITPASTDLKNSYTITAVTGTPDATQHQVGARLISVTTQAQSKTVNATGSKQTPGTQAQGTLTAINQSCQTAFYPVGSVFIGTDGVRVVNDKVINLPDSCPNPTTGQVTVPAHTVNAGSQYNIQRDDIHLLNDIGGGSNPPCPTTTASVATHIALTDTFNGTRGTSASAIVRPQMPSSGGGWWLVCNVDPFTGGQDSSSQAVVQQSDIDGAVNTLEASAPDATQTLQGQIHSNERLVGTPSCKPDAQSDHSAGDLAKSVTVTVSYTCTGEVYDQDGALAAAAQWLKDGAATNPGTGYALVGQVKTNLLQAQITDAKQGIVSISTSAEGIWVFQFSDTQKSQLAQLLVGKSKRDAQALLLSQPGIKQVDIQLAGNGPLPTDSRQITITVQNITGL